MIFVSLPFSWKNKRIGSVKNTSKLTVMHLTMSSLSWQMDTSLIKKPGKTYTLKKRLVEEKKKTAFGVKFLYCTIVFYTPMNSKVRYRQIMLRLWVRKNAGIRMCFKKWLCESFSAWAVITVFIFLHRQTGIYQLP